MTPLAVLAAACLISFLAGLAVGVISGPQQEKIKLEQLEQELKELKGRRK